MSAPPVSLIAIAAGRSRHLVNRLRGCEVSPHPPAEIVVVMMDGSRPHHHRWFPGVSLRATLPLAAVRNAGVRAASCDALAFLDVDCIPTTNYFDRLARLNPHPSFARFDRSLHETPALLS